MSFTKTYTLTAEEKVIIRAIDDAKLDEVSGRTIMNRLREGEVSDDSHPLFTEELMFTILGQLIERGLIERVEQPNNNFTYRRN